ncbi:WxL domain-containing protein [Levilactobacillus hammesii]|nr:WxL domain-containing protein [Levilactobacillus hammesii]
MKMKAKLLISAVALGMALPGAFPVIANAADTPAATADKSASVTVKGGDLSFGTDTASGGIEAPSFDFSANVSNKSQTLSPTNFADTKNADTDKYADSNLAVDDETGTGSGWNVTAKLGTFTGAKNKTQSLGATLNMKTTTPQAGVAAGTDATTTDLVAGSTSATPVFSAASGKGMGTATADFAKSTLTLPTAAYADSYTADLTYELTAGPTA